MKKNFAFLFSLLFLCNTVYATLTASAVFELNSGGSVNGACIFDAGVAVPGTDKSQATTCAVSAANLASTNGTTNPCVVTSASRTFDTTDEGNSITIISGTNWTVQRAIITDTSGGAATLDRACGSAATLSSGTFVYGCACALGNSTAGISDDALFEEAKAGNTIYAKAGTYTPAAISVGASGVGSATAKVKLIGYTSTRGDNPLPNSGNQPIFNFAANTFTFASHWKHHYFEATGTSVNGMSLGTNFEAYKLKVSNTSGSAGRTALFTGNGNGSVIDCDLASTNGVALGVVNANGANIVGNTIHDSATGIRGNATLAGNYSVINNVIRNITSAGIDFAAGALTGSMLVLGNTIYGASSPAGSSKGIVLASGSTGQIFASNSITGFVTGIDGGGATEGQLSIRNNLHNNTTARSNWNTGINDIALAPNYASSTNFAPGPNLKWVGFPHTFPDNNTTSWTDIGAVQRREGFPKGRR